MSNYTVQTNFGAKDGLASGNAAKVIRGADFTVEFNNIATAIGTKLDSAGGSATNFTTVGNLTNSGAMTTAATATFNGDVVVDTDTLFVDVSTDKVGINNAVPTTALDVTGVITTDGLTTSAAINVPDDTKINFGDNNELQIYHDSSGVNGSSTFFSNHIRTPSSANWLYLESDIISLRTLSGVGMISAVNGSVGLADSLQTQTYGVDITGTDGASIIAKVEADDAESANLKLKNTEGEFDIRCDGGTLDIYDVTDSASRLSFDTSGNATFGGNVGTTKVTTSGSLSLNAGAGHYVKIGKEGNTNPHVVVGAENGNMGIGELFPDTRLHVTQTTGGTQIPIMTLENLSASAELQFLGGGSGNSTNSAKIRNKANAIEFSENNRKTLQVGSGLLHNQNPSSRVSVYNEDTDSKYVQIFSGTGSPEGVFSAPHGSLYLRTDGGVGTTLYIKETSTSLNTGWEAK